MSRRDVGPFDVMEALEPRIVLSGGDLTFALYSPEGFAHDSVTEVVTISNSEDVAADFQLLARYETGERDQLLAEGTLAPGEIREITIASAGDPDGRLVRKATPFALELCSDGELSATLRHDDFGGVIVQSFSDDQETTWSFGNGVKDDSNQRDFIVLYNPGDDDVVVTLTGVTEAGGTFVLQQTVEGHRRGGWDLRREDDAPNGAFGLVLDSSSPIVVSRSHYNVTLGAAFGQLGQAGGGAMAGAILGLDVDDADEDFPSVLNLFNAENGAAQVTITIQPGDDDVVFFPESHIVNLEANSFTQIELADFGLPQDQDLTIVYSSDVPITMSALTSHQGRVFGVPSVTQAATGWQFASGSVDRIQDGELRTDDVFIFNPTNSSIQVTVTFTFSNGEVIQIDKSLDPNESEDVDAELMVDADEELGYSVVIEASGFVVASLEGIDLLTDSGFVSAGVASGTVTDLEFLL